MIRTLPFQLVIGLTIGISTAALAAPRVNSGGGGWACRSNDSSAKVIWLRSVDLFEGEQRGLVIAPIEKNLSSWEILAQKRAMIASQIPQLQKILDKYNLDLKKSLHEIPSPVDHTDDAELEFRPKADTCKDGLIYYLQMADTLIDGNVVISAPLWSNPLFPNIEKAAILLHEEVYFALRKELGDETSRRTRILVSLIFSDTAEKGLAQKAAAILADKSIDPPGDRDTVATFPVKLKCTAEIIPSLGGYYWASPYYGSSVQFDLGSFTFRIETFSIDGTPSKMEITDKVTGISSDVDPYLIHTNFIKSRLAQVKLNKNGQSAQSASILCESDSNIDSFPL